MADQGPFSDDQIYKDLIAAVNAIYGSHEGRRALHAKGFFCEATFEASAEASKLSSAAHLQGGPVPALIRFSTGGGNPDGHDGLREARGMAVKFDPGGP